MPPDAGPWTSKPGPEPSRTSIAPPTATARPEPETPAAREFRAGVVTYHEPDLARIAASGIRHVRQMVDTWRGMADPPEVIEVWNEPWHTNFWKPGPDPAAYLRLVEAFAAEAWAQWPDVVLLVSADDGDGRDAQFRDRLLAADTGKLLADPRIRPTTHTYVEARTPTERTGSRCDWDLDRWDCAYEAFKAHGHPDPRVWVTELGWESDTPAPGYAQNPAVSEPVVGAVRSWIAAR